LKYFNNQLQESQPLLLFLDPKPHFLNTSIEKNSIEILSEKFLRHYPKRDKIEFIKIQEKTCYPYFNDKKIQEFYEKNSISHFSPLISEDKLVGFAFLPKNLTKHFHLKDFPELIQRLLKKISDIFVKSLLFDELEYKLVENELLVKLGTQLTSSLTQRDVFNTILNGLERIIHYDAVGIFFHKSNEFEYERIVTRGYDLNNLDLFKTKKDKGIIRWVSQNKKPMIASDVTKNKHYFGVRKNTKSQITVPMVYQDELLGTFTLESNIENKYTEKTVPILKTFAEHAAIAIINAKLFEAAQTKQQLEEELINASKIQRALMPLEAPKFPNTSIGIYNKASKFLGGDIYDIVKLNENELLISIGDVSGKGTPAGILMAVLFASLRSEIRRKKYPKVSELNQRLNHLLFEATNSGAYATFFLSVFNHETKTLSYSNAGHNHPLVIRSENEIINLSKGGMVLGFMDNEVYEQGTIQLKTNDIIIYFTDGLNEAFNKENEEFGEENIVKTVLKYQDKSSTKIKEELKHAVIKHHGELGDLDDDMTIIVLKVK
jgi:sigma-B regulation protein RsbU (phosphoserine phosphatase)